MSPQARTDLEVRFQEYSRYTEIKQLAYTIASLQHEKMFKSLAVLSFFHGEGRTLLCAALALAYVEACRSKVLIVDTTLLGSPGSLVLTECLQNSEPWVKLTSLSAPREKNPNALLISSSEPVTDESKMDLTATKLSESNSNFSMILRVAKENPEQYGLVLLDTMPLSVRNKNNFDPRLVARLSDTSILVVSQKFLDAPKLNEQLKMLEDPALHLIGMISNEEFTR